MMELEYYSSAGLYSSTFLKMSVDTYEDLDDIFTLSDKTSAALLHEYVHYLQDLTTIYGLQNIASVVEYTKYINWKQRDSEMIDFHIPYDLSGSVHEPFNFKQRLRGLSFGTRKLEGDFTILAVNRETVPHSFLSITENAETVTLTLNEFGSTRNFAFGSTAIMEGMAYIIEQMIYPSVLPTTNDFIYTACQKVAVHLYPSFASNLLNVLALADAALMYSYPGAVFHDSLIQMKDIGFLPDTPEEVYDFVFDKIPVSSTFFSSINGYLNNQIDIARLSINDYFTTPELEDNRKWINILFDNSAIARSSNWNLFIGLALSGTIDKNHFFRELFSLFGLPLTLNNYGYAFFAPPASAGSLEPDTGMLWAINQLYNHYVTGRRYPMCKMVEWCNTSAMNLKIATYTDENCDDAPWKRNAYTPKYCPYSKLIKTWDLEKYNFVLR